MQYAATSSRSEPPAMGNISIDLPLGEYEGLLLQSTSGEAVERSRSGVDEAQEKMRERLNHTTAG